MKIIMDKESLLSALSSGRSQFLKTIEGLPALEMEIPGVIDQWSIKDLLVHLTRWEAEIVKLTWQSKSGQKPTTVHFSQETVDEINARWYQQSKHRALDAVMEDFMGVRKQTIRQVKEIPEQALTNPDQYFWLEGRPLWKWIAEDSFEHEAEHADQIKTWRDRER